MNAPVINRSRLRTAVRAVEERYRLSVSGLLPDGIVGHPSGREPIVLLATAADDLSLIDLCAAEIDVEDRLATPARIILESELPDERKAEIAAQVRPV